MLQHKGRRPCTHQALAHLAGIVGREGAFPVQFLIPVGQGGCHLGFRGLQALCFRYQQQPQPAAQLAFRLGVQPGAELFHRLAPHLEELIKVDAVGLQAQVELPLLGKVVAAHQLFGQRTPAAR